mmetsp:Transcript_7329/g.20678  ORF Transcript_7329/g.20678 Transcript_7329/m.20678 type:complete len:226 (-) Transcript_7329:547-1224(-)|eukprot:CAMPEP_0117665710 /NCGR_PEP_ID=MMETSP0804-20121206/9966_1 /TAXON_ID=1074897 /ORGANISM="Tetraselmis astigmatica, Strain CCMP880" /LENGTH=225 /DNA_ID=CAMNT_0005473163 /DNA_START=513 /DNA_END=1190 /DNA_ORIENTATION=-
MMAAGNVRWLSFVALLLACASRSVVAQSPVVAGNETDPNAACDATAGSPEATCAVCLTRGDVDYQVCCCSPYPALVTTSPNESSCDCTTKAGWALILLAILVPILIIGDIILILYCCYKGKCCCFKQKAKQEQNYNVHMGLAEPDHHQNAPLSGKQMGSPPPPLSSPLPQSPPIMAGGPLLASSSVQRANSGTLRVPAPPAPTPPAAAMRPPSTYHSSPQRNNAI